jgi:hypothetical protein
MSSPRIPPGQPARLPLVIVLNKTMGWRIPPPTPELFVAMFFGVLVGVSTVRLGLPIWTFMVTAAGAGLLVPQPQTGFKMLDPCPAGEVAEGE